jgi:prepilin-type N-terminal cleavage/methylation domain-containing protein
VERLNPGRVRAGFTLIELLVVIAIVALLIGLLLPALAGARRAGWMAVSLSNMRQISIAMQSYRNDFKGQLPITNLYDRLVDDQTAASMGMGFGGYNTWMHGGKNNSEWFARNAGTHDVEAADRLLNPYVLPSTEFTAPRPPGKLPPDAASRRTEQALIFRDPSDRESWQRWSLTTWENVQTPGVSCYDDVGTSYLLNLKWADTPFLPMPQSVRESMTLLRFVTSRLNMADGFMASRLVWLNDQYADAVVYSRAGTQIRNGFGDTNKSVLAFLDGHASYHDVVPGRVRESFVDPKGRYTFIVDGVPVPASWR